MDIWHNGLFWICSILLLSIWSIAHHIKENKKKQKRGNYEHQGTPELEHMANKLTLPSDIDRQNEMMDLATTSTIQTNLEGKRKVRQDPMIITTTGLKMTRFAS